MPTENLSDVVEDFFLNISKGSPPQVEIHTLMVAKWLALEPNSVFTNCRIMC